MIIEKNEIATKLRKLKGILTGGRMQESAGILVKGNSLYASNIEIGMKAALSIENSDEEFVIPKKAIELIENLPPQMVEITSEDNHISIKCGSIKNKYQTTSAGLYPKMESISESDNHFTIQSGEFQDALNSALYAVSENITKETLKGILLEASDGTLNVVGCDGVRIAWSRIDYDGDFKVIVPKATIQKMLSIGISGNMSFAWDKNSITFRSKEYEVVSRIINGEYFDYKKMFVQYPNETVIDRRKVSECFKRAIICGEDKNASKSPIKCSFNDDKLCVTLHQSLSEYEEIIPLEVPIAQPLDIAFNGRYILDALNSFISDNLSVRMGESTQPIIIDDGKQSACVLPVKM